MKKVITIVAVVVVALVGLTSYSASKENKNEKRNLLAELRSGGETGVLTEDKRKRD